MSHRKPVNALCGVISWQHHEPPNEKNGQTRRASCPDVTPAILYVRLAVPSVLPYNLCPTRAWTRAGVIVLSISSTTETRDCSWCAPKRPLSQHTAHTFFDLSLKRVGTHARRQRQKKNIKKPTQKRKLSALAPLPKRPAVGLSFDRWGGAVFPPKFMPEPGCF